MQSTYMHSKPCEPAKSISLSTITRPVAFGEATHHEVLHMDDLFFCPFLCHSRSDSSDKQELVSAPNVPDEDTDENC